MTAQERDLLKQKVQGLNNTLVSHMNYVKEFDMMLQQHRMKIEGILLHLQTQQRECVDIFKMLKGLKVEEEEN